MLQGLTGEPEVLNAVTMVSASCLDLRGKAAENTSGRAIDLEKGLTFKAAERGQQSALRPNVMAASLED
jgi:hypothetical protein